jgi:hypothetical protein
VFREASGSDEFRPDIAANAELELKQVQAR